MKGKVKLLICDDNEGYRNLLKAVFSSHPKMEVTGEAADGSEAVEKCIELRPHVVVMDLNMEGCNGLAATQQIQKAGGNIRVLIHSGSTDLGDVGKCLVAGASGYLPKGCAIGELYEAVLTLSGGGTYPGSRVAETMALAS